MSTAQLKYGVLFPNVKNLIFQLDLSNGRHHGSRTILVFYESTFQVLSNGVQHITVLPIPHDHFLIERRPTFNFVQFSVWSNTFSYLLKYLKICQIIHHNAHNKLKNSWDFIFNISEPVVAQISIFILSKCTKCHFQVGLGSWVMGQTAQFINIAQRPVLTQVPNI